MRPTLAIALCAGLASGCLSGQTVDTAALGTAGTAVLLAPSGPAWVVDLADPKLPGAWLESEEVRAATFEWSPAALGLTPGALSIPEDGNDPTAWLGAAYELSVEDGRGRFVATAEAAAFVAEHLRLPPIDDRACLEGGGCRLGPSEEVCLTPCPAPPAVAAPDLPAFECPDGWSEEPVASEPTVHFCNQDVTPVGPDCAPGEARWFEEGCAPVESCPAETFRAAPPGAVYVRAGARGGDGTAAQPYGSITEAMTGAPTARTFALAAGVYEGVPPRSGVRLIGHCASDTTITPIGGAAALRLTALGARLEHLSTRHPLTITASASVVASALFAGLTVAAGAQAQLERVALRAPEGAELRVDPGATLRLHDVSVEASPALLCRPGPASRPSGCGSIGLETRPCTHRTAPSSSCVTPASIAPRARASASWAPPISSRSSA